MFDLLAKTLVDFEADISDRLFSRFELTEIEAHKIANEIVRDLSSLVQEHLGDQLPLCESLSTEDQKDVVDGIMKNFAPLALEAGVADLKERRIH